MKKGFQNYSIVIMTKDKLYPENNWLRIYTDCSAIPTTGYTGAGFFCSLFEGFVAVGKPSTNFDGEVLAILEAASKIPISRINVVFLVDS